MTLTMLKFKEYLPEEKEQLRLTVDKREIKDFPKLPSATSFIRKSMKRILSRKNFKDHHTVAPLLIQAL